MGLRRRSWQGLIIVLGLAGGCASSPLFPYRWYGLNAQNYDGTLQGPTPQDDLNLKVCDPASQPSPAPSATPEKGLCVVFQRDEFTRLKTDHEAAQLELNAYQKKYGPLQ